jgi:Myosin head (motor domain)
MEPDPLASHKLQLQLTSDAPPAIALSSALVQDCLALIETKPNGIIPTLDEQCLIGQPTDERFARELYKKCEGNARFSVTNKMRADHAFQVQLQLSFHWKA